MNQCECGCGREVKRRFIQGHAAKIREKKVTQEEIDRRRSKYSGPRCCRKNAKNVTVVKCDRCNHVWLYAGNQQYSMCAACKCSVNIKRCTTNITTFREYVKRIDPDRLEPEEYIKKFDMHNIIQCHLCGLKGEKKEIVIACQLCNQNVCIDCEGNGVHECERKITDRQHYDFATRYSIHRGKTRKTSGLLTPLNSNIFRCHDCFNVWRSRRSYEFIKCPYCGISASRKHNSITEQQAKLLTSVIIR